MSEPESGCCSKCNVYNFCSKCGAYNLTQSYWCLRCNNKLAKAIMKNNKNIKALNIRKISGKKPVIPPIALRPPLSILNPAAADDEKQVGDLPVSLIKYNSKDVLTKRKKLQNVNDKKIRIKVTVVEGSKIIKTLNIFMDNVERRAQQIIKAMKRGYGILSDVNVEFVDKQHEQLLLVLAINILLIIKSYSGYFDAVMQQVVHRDVCPGNVGVNVTNLVSNATFLFQVIFRNPRMIRNWLYDDDKYKLYFSFLASIMRNKFLMHPKYIHLLQTFLSSYR